MEQLRVRRVLLVLDNLEMLLEEGTGTGRMRAGSQGYARLLRRIGESAHQSCLLLTSREKPMDLVPLEASRRPVRALRLAGLDGRAGAQLLAEQDVAGSPHDRERLVEVYRGNPLALKIVARTIVELFGGEIVPFLEQGEVIFGGVRQLLDEQFDRLSALEQTVFSWLAILREPVSLEELLSVLSVPRAAVQVLEALDGLGRRSLLERGQRAGSFTLHSVVLEYATARLIAEVSREIEQGSWMASSLMGSARLRRRNTCERFRSTCSWSHCSADCRARTRGKPTWRRACSGCSTTCAAFPGLCTGQSGGAAARAAGGLARPRSLASGPAWRVSARRRDARCGSFQSGCPGQRLYRTF
jgi:hypothetical protein